MAAMARSRSMAALVALLLCAASARVADAQGIMGSEATPSASAKYLVRTAAVLHLQ